MPADEDPGHSSQEPTNSLFLLTTIIFNSIKVLLKTKKLSFFIFVFTSFPLSFLLFFLSFLTFPLSNRIQHLHTLSFFSPIHVESEHVLIEANVEAKHLLFLKVIFFFPTFLLSFFTAISSINTAFLTCSNGKPTVSTIFTAVKTSWKRVLVTTMCVYATMLACTVLPGTFMAVFEAHPYIRVVLVCLGSGLELHLMAVTSLALVVSINEGKYGFDAIRVGSGLMEGKRVCGWVLSGLFVLCSGFFSGMIEICIDGLDLERMKSTVVIGLLWDNVSWIFLYACVVQWSFIVTTVFYFELKKRDSMKSDRDSEINFV